LLALPDSWLLLDAMMLGVSDELYLIDATTLTLVYASKSALKNTGYELEDLKQQDLENLLGVSRQALQAHIASHPHHTHFIRLLQDQPQLIGNVGHDQLRVMTMSSNQQEFILIIKNNFPSISLFECVTCRSQYEQKLAESEARFQVMVSNTPGLVFQFQIDSDDEINFIFLSDGCKALLGIDAEELKVHPKLFYALMNTRDRTSLRKRLKQSTIELSLLDWEGRVWIDGWQDTKWINLRSFPRVLDNGVIQWEGIMINITQSKTEKHDIEQSRRDLAELTAHMDNIKEHERSRIAREIHDDLGGNLTAIKIGLSSIINRLKAGQPISLDHAQGLETIVDSTFEAIHKISSDLRPNILDLGIVAALEWQSKEFATQLEIDCQFTCNQAEVHVSSAQAITLFRICQESMSNISKHAHATSVSVDLNASAHEIVMTISDNGVGIKAGDTLKVNSFGLRGMQERVTALHGRFNISKPSKHGQKGTVITLSLPIG
jgi:two-component system, NarL family, sensor histidine kinase UhpB